MANILDVQVIIDVQQPSPRIGFGKPLIIGESTAGSAYKNYSDLAGVAVDFISSTEVYKAAAALFGQGDKSPAEIAVMTRKTGSTPVTLDDFLPTIFLQDWYFLVYTGTTLADVIKIANAVEADNTRQFFTRTNSQSDEAAILVGDYKRTIVFHHTTITNYPEAAWIGENGSAPVGSVTWKFRTLVGVTPLTLTPTELNAIHALGANTYVRKAGIAQTSEGKTVSGDYIDNIHAQDYVKSTIELGVQTLLSTADKIPYDDTGIAQIESVVRTALQTAWQQGIIATVDDVGQYTTTFPTRAQTDPADRAARRYNVGRFTFDLAGAIHNATIRGEVRY